MNRVGGVPRLGLEPFEDSCRALPRGLFLEEDGDFFGGERGGANVVVGDHKRVGGGRVDKFMAEEANGFVFGGWCGAEEGELRERMDVHEVVGLSLSSVVHIGEKELKKSE